MKIKLGSFQFETNLPKSTTLVPFLSGTVSLALLREIIFSGLTGWKFYASLIAVVMLFLTSAFSFVVLKNIERNKDQYLLSTVGKVVEDVFRHYGLAMASNGAGPDAAKRMDSIMNKIIGLVKGLEHIGAKSYTEAR